MATTTPNFGWSVPTSTDLVKDGATAIETLGDSIDASLVDLKGGTTGQVLSKNSNTDMDFIWVTDAGGDITGVTAGTGISGGGTSGTVTVTNSMATAITTAGDLIRGTGSGTFERLGVGSTGQVLTVSGGTPTWATPSGGGKVLQVQSQAYTTATTTTSTSLVDTGITRSITPSATSSKVLVMVTIPYFCTSASTATAGGKFVIYRGATEIGGYSGANNVYITASTGTEVDGTWSITFLDSPATTSATTYKVQFVARASTTTLGISTASMASTITLLEIGA